ncbi:hypothetical protein [Polyangium spumosum]|uniref:Uncharacterized protein n=1 Tax=Polyangium spumosum TaxID=889282 RepID=A0A6N7PL55_9BACT|nr:hypothetical protein [Polyangium spumosum]MRG92758.1 hypothetical protein [Polyangium spumosum]
MTADIESLERLAGALSAGLARDFGGPAFPNPEGYRCKGARLRTFRRTVPVVELEMEGRTLSFIVTPTDPAEPAYRRSDRYDIVYFSEDVPDGEQSRIYARDRATIDHFVAWVKAWDAAGGAA